MNACETQETCFSSRLQFLPWYFAQSATDYADALHTLPKAMAKSCNDSPSYWLAPHDVSLLQHLGLDTNKKKQNWEAGCNLIIWNELPKLWVPPQHLGRPHSFNCGNGRWDSVTFIRWRWACSILLVLFPVFPVLVLVLVLVLLGFLVLSLPQGDKWATT